MIACRDAVLYLEHPKVLPSVSGTEWEIWLGKSSGTPEYTTNRFHGFRIAVPANSTTEFGVCERHIDVRHLSLTSPTSLHSIVNTATIRDWKQRKFIDDTTFQVTP